MRTSLIFILAWTAFAAGPPPVPPGARVEMDAHNCYPYDGRWKDRIDRALSAGPPLAIEQDLYWYTDPATGASRSIVSHGGKPIDGKEPSMRDYFFERIRPLMEEALRQGNHGDWPLITLNLDFKSNEAKHHAAAWKLLSEYEGWLCTAKRLADGKKVAPIEAGPLLVLTGDPDSQQRDFHDIVPVGANLLVFGAVRTRNEEFDTPPKKIFSGGATNYRRWWNNPWKVVEEGGQPKAGDWTVSDDRRLRALVTYAHEKGLWIRFYTLDGDTAENLKTNGWFDDYNFGSRAAAEIRWRAAQKAGADYIASDHYEALAAFLKAH